jgi:acetate---CoA ligase (ADP-forming) subunit alpha
MLKSIDKSPLYAIANPKSIAFFGASNQISSMGTNQLISVLALGYEGRVYPVHPNEEEVQGLKAYRSVLDLPEVPDLAVLVLPTRVVPQVLEDCGRKGIEHLIIVSAGFKEAGGDGVGLERELVEIADRYGMRFLGPNCIGVTNPHHKLNTTFLQHEGSPGYVGMVSQSGSFITQMFGYLDRYGLGFSTAFSVGNEANLDVVDCLEYLALCPNTKVIALYLEGIRRGKAFMEAARAIAPHKPIVALYVGGSETGRRAALSHTGAMAGPDKLYEGALLQSGVIRARSISELFDFCWVLGTQPAPKGSRVAVLTHSGGPGASAADACGRAGLEMPPFSDEIVAKLKDLLPHTAAFQNPVDCTFNKNPQDYFFAIPEVLLQDKRMDMLLVYVLVPARSISRALQQLGVPREKVEAKTNKVIRIQTEGLANLLRIHGKPLVGYTYQTLGEPFMRGLIELGVPVFPGPERAVAAMNALLSYETIKGRLARS